MNPWELLGLVLGWAAVGAVVVLILLLAVVMVLVIVGLVKKVKSPGSASNPNLRKRHTRE